MEHLEQVEQIKVRNQIRVYIDGVLASNDIVTCNVMSSISRNNKKVAKMAIIIKDFNSIYLIVCGFAM